MRGLVDASRVYLSVAGPGGLVESRPKLHAELVMATRGCSWNPIGNAERFAAHLASEFPALFTFLWDPSVDATNWRAEQAIRPAVVNPQGVRRQPHPQGRRYPAGPCQRRTHRTPTQPGAALLRWRPNQSLRRRRGRRQLDPSRRGEERRRVRWPTVLLSSATDGGLPLVLARFVRGLSTHQGSGCPRRLRTAATAAKCHRAPVDSHRVADQMPTGPSMSRRRAPHAASPLPRG